MSKVIILICSVMTPPDQCTRPHAIDVIEGAGPLADDVGLMAQVEMAQTPLGPDWAHYEKIMMPKR